MALDLHKMADAGIRQQNIVERISGACPPEWRELI